MTTSRTEVLIVGAGPSGLALALWLTRLGVGVRIIDRASGPGETSRAFAVQARTLELYDQIGLAETLLRRGRPLSAVSVHDDGQLLARIPFGEFGKALSPFPYILILLQDVHEKLLLAPLAAAGVQVERDTELVSFEDDGGRIRARLLRGRDQEDICEATFLCGCDGVHSILRELIGAEFEGGDYDGEFYVADVEATGAMVDGDVHYALMGPELCRVFPLNGASRVRLIGKLPKRAFSQGYPITFEHIADDVAAATGLKIFMVEWFSTYRVYRRVASRFRKGRVFLLGDASHAHSPAGSQGLNTGIGDAANLAWKISAVLRDGADVSLLDTYEAERRAVARTVVATTDLAFGLQIDPSPFMQAIRRTVARLTPGMIGVSLVQDALFRVVSQLMVHYRKSPLSSRSRGPLHGGDRLPWIDADSTDNFAALRALRWHVQVYGQAGDPLKRACAARGLPLHEFPWSMAVARPGFRQNAAYLVRPDGYLACVSRRQDIRPFEAILNRYKLLPLNVDGRLRGGPCQPSLAVPAPDPCRRVAGGKRLLRGFIDAVIERRHKGREALRNA